MLSIMSVSYKELLCGLNVIDLDSLLQHLTDSHFCCYICEILKNGDSDSSQIEPRSYSSAIRQSAHTTRIHQNEETMQSISTRTFATTEINSAMSNYFKNKTVSFSPLSQCFI